MVAGVVVMRCQARWRPSGVTAVACVRGRRSLCPGPGFEKHGLHELGLELWLRLKLRVLRLGPRGLRIREEQSGILERPLGESSRRQLSGGYEVSFGVAFQGRDQRQT